MKMLPVSPIDPAVESKVRDLFSTGAPIPEVIQAMRSHGLDKIDSIKLLRRYAGLSTGQAKDLVHRSDTWADRLESDERLHDTVEQAVRQAGFVETEISATV